ncbi:hypothetical protein M3Y97_00883900 [Aphelenchoides bicaudatus]|nr:hypothetical protein M3Y97_00883900 [Aphelenchoides bicaudatus]
MSDPLSSVTVIKTNPDDPRAPITRTYSVSDSTEHVFKGHIPGHYYTKQVVRFFSHLNSLFLDTILTGCLSFWQEPPVYNHWQPSHRTMNVYKWPLDYIQPTNSWRHRDFYYGYPMKTPNRITEKTFHRPGHLYYYY